MKGFVLLSEGRSGSSWLGSLTNTTGELGRFGEWPVSVLQTKPRLLRADDRCDMLLSAASTENGRFGIKIFPHHLKKWNYLFGRDLIQELRDRHEVALFVLERKDRLRQAISRVRAEMTQAWNHKSPKDRPEVYDYNRIAEAYFLIEENYAFWRAYLAMPGTDHHWYFYEDLLVDPMPYVNAVAAALDVTPPASVKSDFRIQRDDLTEQWVERFQREAGQHNLMEAQASASAPGRTLGSLIRFLQRKGNWRQ